MKKIIAILTALAVVSMAFAQTVTITNKIETAPMVTVGTIDSAAYANEDPNSTLTEAQAKAAATEAWVNGAQWKFDGDRLLREEVVGEGITADERASVKGRARFHVFTKDTEQKGILNLKPQWQFNTELTAGAKLKPIESLEILVGDKDMYTRGFGPEIKWENGNAGDIKIENVTGGWYGIENFRSGLHLGFTGIDGLYVGGGIATGWGKNGTAGNSLIKKGAFGPFELGAKYDADLFSVGAKYVGQFGGFNGKGGKVTSVSITESDVKGAGTSAALLALIQARANETGKNGVDNNFTDAKFNHHNIYAGFDFKGLKDAKVGTTIGAAVDFDTWNASTVMGTTKDTRFAVSANASMDFRNGITDAVAVTVAYQSLDGKKSKVLPFYIGNDLGYKPSDEASFNLHTSYAQTGLENAMKTYEGATGTGAASVVTLKPSFNFTMGASTFEFGVDTQVVNALKYNKKTANEWAFTSMHGIKAQVKFPISWTYKF